METQEITVNGINYPWKEGWTISDLLEERQIPLQGTAVECNQKIVSRAELLTTEIQPGDRLEVVRLVGGG
jgi:sulfur carrier protein